MLVKITGMAADTTAQHVQMALKKVLMEDDEYADVLMPRVELNAGNTTGLLRFDEAVHVKAFFESANPSETSAGAVTFAVEIEVRKRFVLLFPPCS